MDRFKDCGLIRSVHLPESLFALLRSDLFLVFLKLSLAVLAGGCCREPSSHLHLLLEQVSE